MRVLHAFTLAWALAGGLVAADPPAPAPAVTLKVTGPATVDVGKKCVLVAETGAKKVTWKSPPGCDSLAIDGKRLAVWAPPGRYVFVAMVPAGDDVLAVETVLTVTGAIPPPGPTPVPPSPPGPTPAPKGFRVIFVYETSKPLTPAMEQVMFGEKVRTYLDGRAKGWRRWDKDVDAKNEKDADIKALWEAARKEIKPEQVPCVVVAVDGKADIIPFPAGEADALSTLKKYGGE